MFGRVGRERIVGAAWGTLFTGILAVLIIVGSRETRVIARPGSSPLVYTPRAVESVRA